MTIKITNKTGQSIQLIEGVLKPRGFMYFKELTEQVKQLEKKRMITIQYL